ncbi:MAG: transporter substrate-binding domain-containing protein, partial [Bacteroidetes bacterium]|nr:transporter substrate-binding domain-containing protein [Bacteroidota bacterium]
MKVIWDSKRNWTILLLSIVIVVMVFGQKAVTPSETDMPTKIYNLDLEGIKERGVLRAITGSNSYSYFVYKGVPMGYEYDLLKELTDHLGVELEMVVSKNTEDFYRLLNEGKGDIIANNLIVTSDKKEKVAFTEYYNFVKQVLIQRKPDNWWTMSKDKLDQQLIRNPIDLIGKEVHVQKNSSYALRLQNLSQEIGGDIEIKYHPGNMPVEELIQQVSNGMIDYTVADNNLALMNATYFKNIDIETDISFPQMVAWAVRKNSPELLAAINEWILDVRKNGKYMSIYNKYFKNSKAYSIRKNSDYFSATGGSISIYDDLIKKYAEELDWDWRLLAAMIYKESKFENSSESWAGARGLMQLMPETAERFGDSTLIHDPESNLRMATNYLKTLVKFWEEIPDEEQRIKFVLASYNVGEGHLLDARRLADK